MVLAEYNGAGTVQQGGDKVSVPRDMVYGRPARLERSFQVRMGGGERSDPPARGVLYPGKNKGCQETRGYLIGVSQIRVIEKKHKTKER